MDIKDVREGMEIQITGPTTRLCNKYALLGESATVLRTINTEHERGENVLIGFDRHIPIKSLWVYADSIDPLKEGAVGDDPFDLWGLK